MNPVANQNKKETYIKCKKWKNKKTSEIVNFTHNQLPYAICRPDEILPYELITQEDPKMVF